ncbi:ABC transporter permease [Sphingosinicella sp. BN140058]|uniref:ABC transporter permease n=1 Tax=Sphingosinicella sp. BN140058 TaxID=1892855 RepID=UPI001011CC30|nr:ABC transporter permease [Sphingosinicella sp. BN140058]QAY78717.1 FtsX-like permease family protein [Sphingosinicella sp. BN140058]
MNRFALLGLYRALTRHRLYAALNIGGLALGIAIFLVLGLYVRFETSYETWLPHHDELYRVQMRLDFPGSPFNGDYPLTMSGLLEQMHDDFPGVAGTRLRGGKAGGSVIRDGQAVSEDVVQVDKSLFDILDLPMVAGDGRRALADPAAALISRTAARRYFGTSDPIGQTLTIALDSPAAYRIAGIFEDLPANTDLVASILIPIPATPPPAEWTWYKWGTASLTTILRFPNPGEARAFERKLPAFIDRRATADIGPQASKWLSLKLLPLAETHLQPTGPESAGRKLMVATLGIVGLLTLLIAIVNYVNLATARAGLRAREVAIRKVVGADRGALIRQFLGESIVTVAVAALLGLILAELGLPFVNAVGDLRLAIPYGFTVATLALLTLLIGLAAGLYPALLLSRFPAAAVLASAYAPGGGRSGSRLREALVVLQFGLAIAFMVATLVLAAQMRHVRNADLGFRREGLITVPSLADTRLGADQAKSLLAAFRALPGVTSVGTANASPGDGGGAVDVIETAGAPMGGPMLRLTGVGPDFFRTYGPRLLAGRLLDDAHGADDSTDWRRWNEGRNIIVNRQALAVLGFRSPQEAVGKTVGGPRPRTIVGVIDEMRFFSPRIADNAGHYIYYRDLPPQPIAAIRFTGDPRAMLDRVRAVWRRLAPEIPLRADTADARLAELNEADERAARLFAIGSALAMLIGCVGLWGLAAFNTARRVKEIGIRKTLGASSTNIVTLLLGQFLRPVLIANLLAWPLAWIAARTWLAGFPDRIPLSPLYFAGASLLALAIALLTILTIALRASRAAPAAALRHE